MGSLARALQGGRDFSYLTRTVTQLFSVQLRKDSTLPPLPSQKESSRDLTAGAPELDMLLKVHLQVCKALLQVDEGLGCSGTGSWGARSGGVLSAKGWS